MIGVVLVTHGNLAREFLAATEHIMGSQPRFKAVTVMATDDMDSKTKDIAAAVKQVAGDQGVLIVTDMFGGTPSNLALSLREDTKIEVVSGANLPMLVKLCSLRKEKNKKLKTLAAELCKAARKYITDATTVLTKK